MVVPASSQPNLPRGRPVQETFAMQEDSLDGGTNPSIISSEQVICQLQLEGDFPVKCKPAGISKNKHRGPHAPRAPEHVSHQWSKKGATFVAILSLTLVAGISAVYLRARPEPGANLIPEILPPITQVETRSLPVAQTDLNSDFDWLESQTLGGLLERSLTTPMVYREPTEGWTDRQVAPIQEPPVAVAKIPKVVPATLVKVFKRRQNLSEEDLKRELRWAKEIPPMTSATMAQLMNSHMERFRSFGDIDFEPRVLLVVRPDLRTLPVRHGSPIKLDARSAESLEVFARRLHFLVDNTVPRKEDGEHVKPERLREKMGQEVSPGHKPAWVRPEAVPALRQILMAEDKPLRWLLVELLAENSSPEASAALAQRAVFELSTDLRQRAVQALQGRKLSDFRHILLSALRYPWPPVADHAAEALVALDDHDAVPSLISYLKKPDPQQPILTGQNHSLIHEVVRIHHQSNCLMCHSPAVSGWKDPVAGRVPGVFLTGTIEGQGGGYHSSTLPRVTSSPLLVRADIVFLRQDFSVSTAPAGAPSTIDHRFDFLVRTRPVKPQELSEFKTAAKTSSYPQRESVLWALREITGKNPGHLTEEWVRLFPHAELEVETARLTSQLVQTRGVKQTQLLARFKDREGDAYTQALAEAIPQLKGKNQEQARQGLAERLSRLDETSLRDRLQDADAEIRRAAAKACTLNGMQDLIVHDE
jgi:HEAT repeat protein